MYVVHHGTLTLNYNPTGIWDLTITVINSKDLRLCFLSPTRLATMHNKVLTQRMVQKVGKAHSQLDKSPFQEGNRSNPSVLK